MNIFNLFIFSSKEPQARTPSIALIPNCQLFLGGSRKEHATFLDRVPSDQRTVLNEEETYELDQPCNRHNGQYTCDSSSLTPATECINHLLHGRTSSCTMEKVYSRGIIKRISEAILLVNNALAEIHSFVSGRRAR